MGILISLTDEGESGIVRGIELESEAQLEDVDLQATSFHIIIC